MGELINLLPKLTVNELFIRELMSVPSPCFGLGYVEVQGTKTGFIALRPETPIPRNATERGFSFGHSVLGIEGNPILHFAFEFHGHTIHHGLVIPSNPIAQAVLETMIETQDYFFFAINPDHTATAFRSELKHIDLVNLKTNQEKFKDQSCTPEQYQRAVQSFSEKPDPPGIVMEWVCQTQWAYLDLTQNRLTLNPM